MPWSLPLAACAPRTSMRRNAMPRHGPNRLGRTKARAFGDGCSGARSAFLLRRSSIPAIRHTVSRAMVTYAVERQAGTLAVGDVRHVAEGKRMRAKSQQKISLWSHGNVRQYLTYKAHAAGIQV